MDASARQNGHRPGPPLNARNELDADTTRLHVAMLDDRRRTTAFIEAVREAVRPGDVVVEIGTGTGVLSVVAAQAGAERVYALECGNVAPWARRIFRANGVGDRVRLVRGWADEVALPERADVLIAELIGDDPLGEGIVGATRDAWRRLLKRDARLVPSALTIWCRPVTIPAEVQQKAVLRADRLARWSDWYGIDFGPLEGAWGGDGFVDFVNPHDARGWTALGPPAVVAVYDLEAPGPPRVREGATLRVTTAGSLDGLLLHCELFSGSRRFLSTAPAEVGEDNHWYTPLRMLHQPLSVRSGDRIDVNYWHAPLGTPRCSVAIRPRAGSRRSRAAALP
jgi:protein arginine N-methyltransferase 1